MGEEKERLECFPVILFLWLVCTCLVPVLYAFVKGSHEIHRRLWPGWNTIPTQHSKVQLHLWNQVSFVPAKSHWCSSLSFQEGIWVGCPSPSRLMDFSYAQISFLEELFIALKLAAYSVESKNKGSCKMKTQKRDCVWSCMCIGVRAPGWNRTTLVFSSLVFWWSHLAERPKQRL